MTDKWTALKDETAFAYALKACTGAVSVTSTDLHTVSTADLVWNVGERNGTALAGFLDLPKGLWPDMAIPKLEAAAGVKGDWDYDEETGSNWWGLVGTFKGVTFTVYTHKSGSIKIGAHDGFLGIHPAESLDLAGLKAALLAVVTS